MGRAVVASGAGGARGEVPRGPGGADLTAAQRRILAYASAIGSEFTFPLLAAAMESNEEELAEELERLVHRGILLERIGGDRFAFADEAVRASTYRSLTESRLRVLHRKIAGAMEQLHPGPPPELYADLGRHFFLGKVPEKSLDFNRRAAEAARAAGEPERAIQHFERVLLDLPVVPGDHRREQVEVLQTIGDLYYSRGDYTGADRYYGEALEGAEASDPALTARLLLARAEIARENLEVEDAGRGALEARRLFLTAGDPVGVAETHHLVGRLAFQRGDYQESLDENMRALDLLEGNRDPRLMGRLSIDLGNSFALLGDDVRPVAIEWYERAIERLTLAGDWTELSRAYHNLGVAVGPQRPQDGLEYLARARQAAEKGHDTRSAAWSLLSGVEMQLALGEIEEAERDNEQAARLLAHLSDDLGLEQVSLNRGEVAERRGRWDDAEKAYLDAVAKCRRFNLGADEAEVQYRLARLRSKTRDWAQAWEAFHAAERLGFLEVRPNLAGAFEELRRTLAQGDGGETAVAKPRES